MRAVIATGDGRVDVAEVAAPDVVDDSDAIVRVSRAAICGTDLGLLRTPGALTRGARLGHEFVGTVEAVGSTVRAVSVGTRVFASDYTACGTCWWCRRREHWHCPQRRFFGTGTAFGDELPGAQAEYVRVPFADVVLAELPDAISDNDGVFLGDLVPTGWAALDRAAMRPGDVVVVTGAGPVGQIASLVAQARGAGPVIVSDPDPRRREVAQRCGAMSAEPAAVGDIARSLTAGRGADVVVDGIGGETGLAAALGAVRAGGRIVSVGVPHHDRWDAPIRDLFVREVSVSFAVGDAIRDRDEYLGLVSSGLLGPAEIVSRVVALERVADGYVAAAERTELKVLISM